MIISYDSQDPPRNGLFLLISEVATVRLVLKSSHLTFPNDFGNQSVILLLSSCLPAGVFLWLLFQLVVKNYTIFMKHFPTPAFFE